MTKFIYDNDAVMTQQDNSESNLRFLLATNEISLRDYFFRQGAEAMNIKTYEL
tara:strand:- start:749 stop:907 length:159 start_codon:yes stop_codon:yes gene_type:complete